MKFEKHFSKIYKANYLSATIPMEEVEGLQADVELIIRVERGRDSEFPTIAWKMTLDDGKEYGDFVNMYVKEKNSDSIN